MIAPRLWGVAAVLLVVTACPRPVPRDPSAPKVPDPQPATPGTTGDVPQVPPVVAP